MSKLNVLPREMVGKKVKHLRAEDKIPAALYGPGYESVNVLLDTKEFKQVFSEAGYSNLIEIQLEGDKKERVLIKEVQIHPLKDNFLHVSMYVINKNMKITADVPVHFEGVSPAEDMGKGFVIFAVDQITIHCLPDDLPSEFVVDISTLVESGDAITIADVKLPDDVELDSKMEGTTAVAYVTQPQKVEDLLTADAEGAEGAAGEAAEGGEEASESDDE